MNHETGENIANNITVLATIKDNVNLVKYYRNSSQYIVTLINDTGGVVGGDEIVVFNINGVFYAKTTNSTGQAKLNINLQPGDYIITVEYKNCKVTNNITVKSILTTNDLKMSYRDGSRFSAKLVNGIGNPLADSNVTFNINGVLYTRITNSEGIAYLNINLMSGEYIITSGYNGCNTANTITVTP